MTVKLAVEAHYTLILTDVLVVLSKHVANLIMADERLLAVGRLMAQFATVMAADFIGRIAGVTGSRIGLIVRSP